MGTFEKIPRDESMVETCTHGHPLTAENVGYYMLGERRRWFCRQCKRAAVKREDRRQAQIRRWTYQFWQANGRLPTNEEIADAIHPHS